LRPEFEEASMPKNHGAVLASYVMVHMTVTQEVSEEVMNDLRDWMGRKYSNTTRASRATGGGAQPEAGGWTFVSFHIHKRYNPHHVAKRLEKKLNKLLAAAP